MQTVDEQLFINTLTPYKKYAKHGRLRSNMLLFVILVFVFEGGTYLLILIR